jgi:hypothetical protein
MAIYEMLNKEFSQASLSNQIRQGSIPSKDMLAAYRVMDPSFRQLAAGVDDGELFDAYQRRKKGEPGGSASLRERELRTFLAPGNQLGADELDSDFFATREPVPKGGIGAYIDRVLLVHRLREVAVQIGFTRLEAPMVPVDDELDLGVTLAALGLYERAAGRDDRAAKFLEAATTVKVVRPLAYLELARLRFAAAKAQPGGADGKFSPTQTGAIVGPLLVARTQPPLMSELYELVAETYVRSETAPKAETLAVLVEGVQLYPRRLGLVYQTAVLCLSGGEVNNAALLIEHGLRYARAGPPLAGFAALGDLLPPGAAAAATAKAAAPAKS